MSVSSAYGLLEYPIARRCFVFPNAANGKTVKRDKLAYIALITFGITLVLIATNFPSTLSSSEVETTIPPYSGVEFPTNYQSAFVQYASVQRPDGTTRNLYINPMAIEAIRNGNHSLPHNTVIIIEGYYALKDPEGQYMLDADGHYVKGGAFEMLHVLEKRIDWKAADFVSEHRIGNWNFGSFNTATGDYFDENMSACFHCHNATFQTDFMYSIRLLNQYIQTQQVQFFQCDLPDRIAC